MRILILIALLFTFTVGSYVDMASAASGHAHVRAQLDQNTDVDTEPCHSNQEHNYDENGCDGCCCVHSHSMATAIAPIKISFDIKKHIIIASADHHRSIDISGLKRPPRL
jgi:hypothetical protein